MPFKWFGKVNFAPYTKVSDFADYLRDKKLKGTKCKKCGEKYFPPRGDCVKCLSSDIEWIDYSGKGKIVTYTKIYAAPTGFTDIAPYTIGLVELEEGGRLLAWVEGINEIKIGMDVKVVPKMFEEIEEIKVYYAICQPH
ncbi:MAG: Zn-ribbon domain-containing OB-fold protein [Candidatus Thermoplasmatota archaeon]